MKIILSLFLLSFTILSATNITLIDSVHFALPAQYKVNSSTFSGNSKCAVYNNTVFFAAYSPEMMKVQALTTLDNNEFLINYALALDTEKLKLDLVGLSNSNKSNGYTLVSNFMVEDSLFYLKTSKRFNVYNANTFKHQYNCTYNANFNDYSIIHLNKMYSTTMDPLHNGVDSIGIIFNVSNDQEFTPDKKMLKEKYFLTYNRYLKLMKMEGLANKIKSLYGKSVSNDVIYMVEGERSEYILEDWNFLIVHDTLFAASSFGTDFYNMTIDGLTNRIYNIKGFETVRENELKLSSEKKDSEGFYSKLTRVFYDPLTNNLIFYYSISKTSYPLIGSSGAFLIWSLNSNSEITPLIPIDSIPIKIEDNKITSIKVMDEHNIGIYHYILSESKE